jgi:cysteine synthase
MNPTPFIKLGQNYWPDSENFTALIKDESKNPYGTIKDRRNLHVLEVALKFKVDKLVILTSGNNGYSLCQLAKGHDLKIVCFVDQDLPQLIHKVLTRVAYKVIPLNLKHRYFHSEELISFVREKHDEVIWDVTNGYEENYQTILHEILKEISPHFIVVPVGSGGIYFSFVSMSEKLHLPTKIIGIGVEAEQKSIADKLCTPWTPYQKALEAFQKSGHPIYRLSEMEVKRTFDKFKKLTACEPSSSVVFAAPYKHHFKNEQKVVFLNTGRGIYK